jgi:hypothetical protein
MTRMICVFHGSLVQWSRIVICAKESQVFGAWYNLWRFFEKVFCVCWLCVRLVAVMWGEGWCEVGKRSSWKEPRLLNLCIATSPSLSLRLYYCPVLSFIFYLFFSTSFCSFHLVFFHRSWLLQPEGYPVFRPTHPFFSIQREREIRHVCNSLDDSTSGFAMMIVRHDEWKEKSFKVNSDSASGRHLTVCLSSDGLPHILLRRRRQTMYA